MSGRYTRLTRTDGGALFINVADPPRAIFSTFNSTTLYWDDASYQVVAETIEQVFAALGITPIGIS